MKKILSLVVAVLIAIGHLNAKEVKPDSPAGVSVIRNGSSIKLFYRGEQSGRVNVIIYNAKGVAVYKETFQNTENFMRPYDFSALPTGDYTIQITDVQGKYYQNVKYSGPVARTRVAHLTRLTDGDGRYLLSVPNQGDDQLLVKIYDESNAVVYTEVETISGNFAKVYDLNAVQGSHTFEITDKSGKVSRLAKPLP